MIKIASPHIVSSVSTSVQILEDGREIPFTAFFLENETNGAQIHIGIAGDETPPPNEGDRFMIYLEKLPSADQRSEA